MATNGIADYFRSNLIDVRNAFNVEEFHRFISYDNHEDRIKLIFDKPQTHSLSLDVNGRIRTKDSIRAAALKEQGNTLFARGKFSQALECYSNAVVLAPKQDLGILLGNRSACLYHLEYYDRAVQDIDEAFLINYPKQLVYKLQERKARCLLVLKDHEGARRSFRCSLKALDDAKLDTDKKLKLEADMRLMLAIMDKGNHSNDVKKMPNNPIPRLVDSNPLYPSLSGAVEIMDDGGVIGRHGIATRDIRPGDILAIEKPHCACLLPEYGLTHCHLCFERILAPVPASCDKCIHLVYCSQRCRNSDEKVHRYECSLLPILYSSKASITCYLAIKIIIEHSFDELIRLKDSKKFQHYYQLLTHEGQRSNEDIFHRTYMACWLLRLLKKTPYFPETSSELASLSDEEARVGALILHNLQIMQFNTHEISELWKPKDGSLTNSKNMFIGGGVYPTMARLNHSCNPGVIRYFIGSTMVVRAIRGIAKGEEVSDNYGPIFTFESQEKRHNKLKSQYWFDCRCQACVEHWPDLENIDPTVLKYAGLNCIKLSHKLHDRIHRFKCPTGSKCGNVITMKINANRFLMDCPKCQQNINVMKNLKSLQDTDHLRSLAEDHLKRGNIHQALNHYYQVLNILDNVLVLPIKDYHVCQQEVRSCLLTYGNVYQLKQSA